MRWALRYKSHSRVSGPTLLAKKMSVGLSYYKVCTLAHDFQLSLAQLFEMDCITEALSARTKGWISLACYSEGKGQSFWFFFFWTDGKYWDSIVWRNYPSRFSVSWIWSCFTLHLHNRSSVTPSSQTQSLLFNFTLQSLCAFVLVGSKLGLRRILGLNWVPAIQIVSTWYPGQV